MNPIELRPCQLRAVNAVFEKWKTERRTLIVLPTGCGKTVVVAEIAKRVVADGGRFLFAAHTNELIQQAKAEMESYTGLPCAIEKASETAHTASERITIASIQSIGQSRRMKRFSTDHYDVVAADEAHRSPGATFRRVFDYFGDAKGLGVTASPQRSDKIALATVFDSIAYEYRLTDAIKDGYLVPIMAHQMPLAIDLRKVTMRHGDWDENEVDEAVRPHLEAMAKEVMKHERAGISFLPLVQTAKDFASILKDMGMKAEAVWGSDPDRDEKIAGLKSGAIQHLTNANLLTEGFNCPRVSLILPAIPTRSRSRYIQQIGRGTRTCDGKVNLLVIDPLWLASKHPACSPASLFGEIPEVVEAAEEKRKMNGGKGNPQDYVEEAVSDYARQREQKMADEIERNKWKKARSINPLDFASMVHDDSLSTYEPTFKWEKDQASAKQKEYLQKAGFDVVSMTKGEAQKIFETMHKRREKGLATPKQVKLLDQLGLKEVQKYSFSEASKVIDVYANCRWQKHRALAQLKKKEMVK